jgi:HPt (histidine-containing phosphotransfer) domain-containing protein
MSKKVPSSGGGDYSLNSSDPSAKIVDLEGALIRLGGSQQLLTDMASFFREDVPQHLQTIHDAIVAQRGPELELAAHSLKGLGLMFTAKALIEAAAEMERMGRANDFVQARQALDQLVVEAQRTSDALRMV